jgi:DNA-binding CsgD family transcriptional regulator
MRTRAPVLIGRDAEIRTLEAVLSGVGKGRGRSVFLVGEAGVGKSRLAAEVVGRAVAAGMVVLRGRASTIGPLVSLRPLTEAMLSLSRRRDLPPDRELGPYRPVLGRLVPEWNTEQTTYSGESLVVLAEAVLRLMAVVGGDRGCLLALEDLHDADAETLAVLEYLADNLAQESSMLLATCRSGQSGAVDLARWAAQRDLGDLLELDRLGYPDVRRLIGSCLDAEPDSLPENVLQRLWEYSVGNPFIIEELLHEIVSSGQLALGAEGWRVVDGVRVDVPVTVVRAVTQRAERLGPQAWQVLCAAAVLGTSFPLSVVQRVTGLQDHALLSEVRAAVTTQLVSADERGPDWYAFQHPLIAEALLSRLIPTERAAYSQQAADAVEAIHPQLPGEWCQLVATLRLAAGDQAAAARLFAVAGRRALADAASGSAVALLERAERLFAACGDQAGRAEVLEALLYTLAESGQFERAFQLAHTLDASGSGLDVARRIAVRVRLAWVAQTAGRSDDCAAQVAEARMTLGPDPSEELSAPVDAIAAHLALDLPGKDRVRQAEAFARRAIGPAERIPLPMVACQAWYAIGMISRERDLAQANAALRRTQAIAEEHQLPIWRLWGLGGQATNAWLAEADTSILASAREEALRVGAVTVALNLESVHALHTVLCGDFAAARTLVDQGLSTVRRMQLVSLERYLLMTQAVLAAHQGRRAEMEHDLAEFLQRGGGQSRELPLTLGLARTFCALLEENRDLAERELASVVANEEENPVTFHLAGRHGLYLLLGVLARRVSWRQLRDASASGASRMRWNRHFVQLAHAVLLGRSGHPDKAEAMVAQAQRSAETFAMASHLGLRLIAEPAHEDGWGEPVTWLRRAEEYFHQGAVPSVTGACRALLRQFGESVPQRRTGADRISPRLRERGVTVREFEVFELLVLRLSNRTIADRLHISPRTVEKHVAALLLKADEPNRAALVDYAQSLRSGQPPEIDP